MLSEEWLPLEEQIGSRHERGYCGVCDILYPYLVVKYIASLPVAVHQAVQIKICALFYMYVRLLFLQCLQKNRKSIYPVLRVFKNATTSFLPSF